MTELETARQIASGDAPSPTPFGSFQLWAIRITGTGAAERTALNETVYRDPNLWLNDETLARLNGLPVIIEHPAKSGALTSKEYNARNVGTVLFPYVADANGIQNDTDPLNFGPDIWAVARIYDDATNAMLCETELSTSPAVIFKPSDGNTTIPMGDGSHVLVEATPSLICHVAFCERGVWDRGEGGPRGIRNDNLKTESNPMTEKPENEDQSGIDLDEPAGKKADASDGVRLDKLLSHLDDLHKRLDAMEKRGDARPRKDAARKDADPEQDDQDEPLARPGTPRRVMADAEAERADAAEKANCQARADAIYTAMGSRAAPPMMGEKLQAYRARLARGLQRHSAGFNKVDLHTIKDQTAFDSIENQIYADAMEAAKTPETVPGVMREMVTTDASGRRISNFYGDHTFISQMKRPSRRLVGINTKV